MNGKVKPNIVTSAESIVVESNDSPAEEVSLDPHMNNVSQLI